MNTGIIYHDFQTANNPAAPQAPAVLTASVLEKGRRRAKTLTGINTALNTTCLVLCGACIGVSVFVLGCIMMMGL